MTQPIQPQQPQPQTMRDIQERIIKEAAIDLTDYPILARVVFQPVGGEPQLWERGKAVPKKDELLIVAMFREGNDVHAYVLADASKAANEDKRHPPARYIIKDGRWILVEVMDMAVWEGLIVEALGRLADEEGGGDDMAECSHCGELNDEDAKFCSACGREFKAAPNGAGEPAPSPSP